MGVDVRQLTLSGGAHGQTQTARSLLPYNEDEQQRNSAHCNAYRSQNVSGSPAASHVLSGHFLVAELRPAEMQSPVASAAGLGFSAYRARLC